MVTGTYGIDEETRRWINADDSGGRARGFGDGYFDGLGAEDGGGMN